MRKIVFCSKCGYFGSIGDEMIDVCPKCNVPLVSTSITKEEWDALSKDEKDELKKLLLEKKKQSVLSVKELADREDFSEADGKKGTSFDSEQKAILKGLGEDVHFIKTVLLIIIIINAIVVFYSVLRFVPILQAIVKP